MLGNALAGSGRAEEAMLHYRRATEIGPQDGEACDALGNALASQGRFDEAIAQYEKAIELQPDNADACYNLGNALAVRGRPGEAIAQYQRALQLKPDDATACNNLGNVLAGQGRFEEAWAQYCRALEIEPDHVTAHVNLGNLLAAEGRFDQAIARYRKALEVSRTMWGHSKSWLGCGRLARTPGGARAARRSSLPSANQSSGTGGPTCSTRWPPPTPKRGGFRRPWQPRASLRLAGQQGNARPWPMACVPESPCMPPESPIIRHVPPRSPPAENLMCGDWCCYRSPTLL